MKKITISIFTGGSGNTELIKLLSKIRNVELNLIINGYDDGKSTKYLRNTFKGMLGPSDFRKNTVNLLNTYDHNYVSFKYILEHRFKNFTEFNIFKKNLKNNKFKNIEKLKRFSFDKLYEFKKIFNLLNNKKFEKKNFKDVSLGNLLFCCYYIKYKKFNLSLYKFTDFFNLKKKIHNVTNGKNLYLHCLSQTGNILNEEDKIIENNEKHSFEEIYLLKKKLSKFQIKVLNKKPLELKKKFLNKLNFNPEPSSQAIKSIKKSDIIIYGPGTQYSSLFPSYLTKKIGKTLSLVKGKKFFIMNIFKDNDIINITQKNVFDKFEYFLSKGNSKKLKNICDFIISHKIDMDDVNNKNYDDYLINNLDIKQKKVIYLDWEKTSGQHMPNLLIKNIFKFSKKNYDNNDLEPNSVSIILPCLNEGKILRKALNKINKLNLSNDNIFLEFIFIDGGSNDNSLQIAKSFNKLKIYSLKNKGRGLAIDFGIKKAKGDIIALFPTDNEYEVSDLELMIKKILNTNEKIIFGSRLIKCTNLSNQIKKVYKKNYFGYIISKYGGLFVSILMLLFYNRFITDPFSTVKIFNAKIIKNLKINSTGVNYDIEQTIKLIKKNIYIHEHPVKFIGRNFSDGKKITIKDGFSCVYTLLKNKI